MTKRLRPMVVQALVGLCCLRRHPDAVEVMVGDLVLDAAAKKRRDVDVTVTMEEADGSIRAFKAYEVKREGRPVGVGTVEQLSAKLLDMPAVTHRAIVSSSGYSEGAISKAEARGVELYAFRPWEAVSGSPVPSFGRERLPISAGQFRRQLLCWGAWRVYLHAPDGPSSFTWRFEDKVLNKKGGSHDEFLTLGDFVSELLLRSTQILVQMQDRDSLVAAISDRQPEDGEGPGVVPLGKHTHTLEVSADNVFLELGPKFVQVASASISGDLEWQHSVGELKYHLVERVPDGEPFAGAAIAEYGTPDERMAAFVFAPGSQTVGVHPVVLDKRHREAIRQLRIKGE
jgi:hypothetical protein